ncbi:unnamed protein product [Phytophthora fragariaefolia]|uniref:Unnamed protein product n=1 Tax=Phytophthora fragariaefolia TaxID=1490495 RepID=A0A9W6YQ43_9STRA|nr:unnamed protein product [Phytophthora fragariaefolia]
MKVQIVLVALACAGTDNDIRYERSGSMTADFTQRSCSASGGSIDPSLKGNQKCCNVPDARQGQFNSFCQGLKAGNPNYFFSTAQPC